MFRAKFDEKTKEWSSLNVAPVFDPRISVANILLRSMCVNGSKVAQICADTGERQTYSDIRTKTIRAAQNLQTRGIGSDCVFGTVCDNLANLPPIVFAALCLGCPFNPLNAAVDRSTLIRIFGTTKPSVIFCDVKAYDLLSDCLKEMDSSAKVFTFNGTKDNSEPVENLFKETGREEDFEPADVDGIHHLAAIMSSSGTEGQCKGISISHANLITRLSFPNVVSTDDIILSFGSLYWITGLIVVLTGTVEGATRVITTQIFSPELFLRIIEEYRVTCVFCPPIALPEVAKSGLLPTANLSSVRHMIMAGATTPFHIREEIHKYLPNGCTNNSYGTTEMCGGGAIEFPGFQGTDTVGRISNAFAVKIVDDDGNRCGIDGIGEVCIKMSQKFLGYYKTPELTAKAVDSEGFFITGDIGYIDQDGYLYLIDRKKEMFVYTDRVFPSKIEKILLDSPQIHSVCVVGVPYGPTTDIPVAVVVRERNSTITEEEISKMVADNLPDHYQLRGGVYFVDSIPTTLTGKIVRKDIKKLATEWYEARKSRG